MAAKNISLKLLINMERNRVVLAEADEEFVNLLLTFLTWPMGKIINGLGKDSKVGCMDALYKSVENLDTRYVQSDACKTMLLDPKVATDSRYYICHSNGIDCTDFDCRLTSSVKNVKCRCGRRMDLEFVHPNMRDVGGGKGVFVKEGVRYLISDDLYVKPASITNTLLLYEKLGVDDKTSLEQRTVDVGKDEVLYLLNRALLSNTPLTDAFLLEKDIVDAVKLEQPIIDMNQSQKATESVSNSKTMSVKLFLRKSSNNLLCAEAQGDLIDLLFSFLTFPLGSIIELFGGNSGMGCVDHLYKSVEDLSITKHMKSDECRDVLLSPKLVPHFGCDNQLLDIKEAAAIECIFYTCLDCSYEVGSDDFIFCHHISGKATLNYVNPKLNSVGTEFGGGFVKESAMFSVTDDLAITLSSPFSMLDGFPVTDIEEQIVSVGQKEALSLLRASLLSKTALSHVFAKSL